MPSIVTRAELKDYCRDTITASDAFYDSALDAAELSVSQGCARQFVAAGAATPRVFRPSHPTVLRVDDCTAITSVSNFGSTVAAASYQLEPLNGRVASGEVRPFEQIRLLGTTWDPGNYDGQASVTVTASWGWASIPAPIKEAVKIIAKDILSNRDVRFGLVAVTDVAGITARTNPTVKQIIADYRRTEAFGIG